MASLGNKISAQLDFFVGQRRNPRGILWARRALCAFVWRGCFPRRFRFFRAARRPTACSLQRRVFRFVVFVFQILGFLRHNWIVLEIFGYRAKPGWQVVSELCLARSKTSLTLLDATLRFSLGRNDGRGDGGLVVVARHPLR